MEDIQLLNKRSEEVVALVKKIEESRGVDSKPFLENALELHSLAISQGNKDLVDLACCYLGEAYCHNYDYENGFYFLGLGMPGLEKTDEYELLTRCYNELGILYTSQGGVANAQENYLKGISLAREHRFYYREAILCHNFAALCEELDDVQDALQYRYQCLECIGFLEGSEEKNQIWAMNSAVILRMYCKLGEKDKIDQVHKELYKFIELHPEYRDELDVQVTYLYYYMYMGDIENANRVKNNALKAFAEIPSYDLFFDDCHAFASYLFAERDFENLEMVLNTLSNEITFERCTNYHMAVYAMQIRMYEETGDIEKASEAALNYYKVAIIQKTSTSVSFKSLLRLRSSLNQETTKNIFLSAQADTDALTGMPNRKKMGEVMDKLFDVASANGKNYGVEMMDIDFFKLVNDKFGHEKGDEVLKGVADVLRTIVDEKTFAARYGGDEFVIFFYDMSDKEIMKKAALIREGVEALRQSLGYNMLSVSQGMVNNIPISINRPWDYMNVADETLYFVKGNGKDNARLVHSIKEITQREWVPPFEPHDFNSK